MIKFSIFLPTYNRQSLVTKTIESLISQTYTDFEVLLYDNGSYPSVRAIVDSYQDGRIRYKRYEDNQNVNDLAEDAIGSMGGSYFLFLADDDVLVPSALKTVCELLVDKPEIQIIQVGVTHFNHTDQTCEHEKARLEQFSGRIEIFNSKEVASHFINGWGIGPRVRYPAPRTNHSSGIFISKKLIETTRKQQKELFIKPFGDIGYVGAMLNTEKYYYLDLPIAIVGETTVREMNGAKKGQRHKWDNDVQYLEHSPLKAPSFINMGADAHLKVLFRNHFNEKYDSRLRPNFYYRHLKQVLSDSPWTSTTLKDAVEIIPHVLVSFITFFSLRYDLAERIRLKIKKKRRKLLESSAKTRLSGIEKFEDINQFASWVDKNFIGMPSKKDRP